MYIYNFEDVKRIEAIVYMFSFLINETAILQPHAFVYERCGLVYGCFTHKTMCSLNIFLLKCTRSEAKSHIDMYVYTNIHTRVSVRLCTLKIFKITGKKENSNLIECMENVHFIFCVSRHASTVQCFRLYFIFSY